VRCALEHHHQARRQRPRVLGRELEHELEVSVSASDAVQVNGMPLLRFITGGGLDGARLVLERAFSAGPGQPWVGALALFSGRIGTPRACRCAATPSCWTRWCRGTCTSRAA
jgi:hypothetical protein